MINNDTSKHPPCPWKGHSQYHREVLKLPAEMVELVELQFSLVRIGVVCLSLHPSPFGQNRSIYR